MISMWIDIHTHLDKLEEGVESALLTADKVGVRQLITIGTEPADHSVVLELARKYSPQVYCTLGVHPHEASLFNEEVESFITSHLSEAGVVAVGEIGLDYFYDHADRAVQQEVFSKQLEIAKAHRLPVEIHTRDAEEDTINILKGFRGSVTGVIHCFTGSEWLARQCLDLGFNISISGVVTFKNADSLRDIVRFLPIDRLHVETDAPFLAPVPQRGKKNTPAFVIHTAEKVATLKEISLERLAEQTQKNAKQIFHKIEVI